MSTAPSLVALTGGTGFLGSHIADSLLAAGHNVRIAVRATSNLRWLENKPLETVVIDLNDPVACAEFLSGAEQLVHCAGVVSAPDEAGYQQGNVQSTINLLAAANQVWSPESPGTFLLISSLAAHGPAPLHQPAVEDAPCHPITAYGRSKRDAEEVLLATDANFRRIILRPPSLYGPRDREFLPLLQAATKGWTVRLGRSITGLSLVDGRDCAEAAVALLATSAASGIYFIADSEVGYDWNQMRDALSKMAGRPIRRLEIPMGVLRAVATMMNFFGGQKSLLLNPDRMLDLDSTGWVCNGSRLTRETGFSCSRNAATGFAETLEFYRKNQWL